MYDAWFCYSPVKNNIQEAQKCIDKNTSSFGAAEAEFNFFNWTNKMMKIAGVHGFEGYSKTFRAKDFSIGPKVILDPKFFLILEDIRQNLGRGLVKFSC